jgi:lysyl-tRNA synthetase class 2
MTVTWEPPAEVEDDRRPRSAGAPTEFFAGWVGRTVTLAAIWSLVSIPLRGFGWPDVVDDAFGLLNFPAEPNLFVVVLMFVVGGALRRRLRAALVAVLLFEILVAALQVLILVLVIRSWDNLSALDLGITHGRAILLACSTILGALLTVALWLSRRAFPARLDKGSWLPSLGVLAGGLAISGSVAFILTEIFPRDLHGTLERVHWALRATFGLTYKSTAPALHGHSGHHWVASVSGVLSALALLAALVVFLRSVRARQFLTAHDELAVRRLILESGGRDSLAYFATRREKSVVFSPDGRAAVTFRVVASVSLASADPLGHVGSWPGAIQAWLTQAREHGCFPAVLSASEAGAKAYVRAGLKALAYGDEAIIDVESFSLKGRTMRPVRQAVARVGRAGYTCRVRRHGDIPREELGHLTACAEAWRGNDTERGFSMALNRLGDPADRRCVMITAHDAAGVVRALLSFVPWGATGVSLDLMRRDRDAENGLIEFMVNGLVEAAADLRIQQISLNFAVFRSVFSTAERVGAGPVTRLNEAVLSAASRFWQIETLYRSNAKYLPRWLPRFLCYDSSLTFSRAVIAAAMAEGFLPAPRAPVPRDPLETILLDTGATVLFPDAVERQEAELLRRRPPAPSLSDQERVRRDKLGALQRAGCSGYPATVPRSRSLREVRSEHDCGDPLSVDRVSITGRVRALRDLGGVSFAVLEEEGHRLQAMLTADATPADVRRLWKRSVDLGDLVSITGDVVRSRRGELSVLVEDWVMAAKCLRPLPGARHRLTDPDTRLRQRYLDMVVNPASLHLLHDRSVMVKGIRDHLAGQGFLEVETPMLQAIHGGAAARPFKTRSNAYDTDLFLRIAPELYLKRLCVGGMQRIFELNRNFRNEGVDATHNPEFTSLEVYEAYADYHSMRDLACRLIMQSATLLHGDAVAVRPDDGAGTRTIDLTGDWPVIPVHEAVSRATGCPVTVDSTGAELRKICERHGIRAAGESQAADLVLQLYEALVEKQTLAPTFYTDFPLETSPLTRPHRHDDRLAERWDLVAFGYEIGTAYSELIDPIDQRDRLTDQSLKAAAGDLEALHLDEDFLTALEYGMPPTGGLGLGVDRLLMMLTGTSIRSTIAFPFVRPAALSHE